MRLAVVAVAVIIAALTEDMNSAAAQESFFNERFCTRGGGARGGGDLDCAYHTWAQCIATARGLGRYCTENPFWRLPVPDRRQQPRRHPPYDRP
ncbi:MAG TPA: DUF3551 domain-containing protein [Xanthobacteraceae bacterium]|jgi:hypothetical protein